MRTNVVALSAKFPTPGDGELIRVDASIASSDGTTSADTGYLGIAADDSGIQRDVVDTFGDEEWDSSNAWVEMGIGLPQTWGDVVGIDPVEEDSLIGLNSFVTGTNLQRGLTTSFDDVYGVKATRVPVITPSGSDWRGQVNMTITQITGADLHAIGEALRSSPQGPHDTALVAQLTDGIPSTVIESSSAPLGDLASPLRDTLITFSDGHFETGEGEVSASGRNVVLLSDSAPYQTRAGGELGLASLGTWGDVIEPAIDAAQPPNFIKPSTSLNEATQYRPLTVAVPEPFKVDALGTYDLDGISTIFGTADNYVPLGIYRDPGRQLLADAEGRAVNQPLPASINPGGLNPLPPIGLTNLETVEALRGDHFIDAIRVRVSGVSTYSSADLDRIAQVAAAIHDRTGLDVEVVAGSSAVDERIQVDSVGTIGERWTTLGEAPRITSGAEGLSGLLLLGAALVVVLYLASFGVFLVDDQRKTLEVLAQIGWRRGSRVWLVTSQSLLLGTAAALLSVGFLATFHLATATYVSPLTYGAVAIAVIAAHMAVAGAAALTVRGPRSQDGNGGRWLSLGVYRLGIRNATENRRRTLVVVIALAISITVAGSVAAVEIAYGGELRTTLLGNLIWLRVGWFHVVAAAAALFAASSIALDSGVLAVERRIALIALLRATGWRALAIARSVGVEVGLAPALGGVLASLPIVLIGLWLALPILGAIALGLGGALTGLMVALLVAVLPMRVALSVDPARGLIAERATSSVSGLAPRAALATVGALTVFVLVAGAGYAALAPTAIPADAFVPVPTAAPLSPEAAALLTRVQEIASHPDRMPGSASMTWITQYIGDQLAAIGSTSTTEEVILDDPAWLDTAGEPVARGSALPRGIAVTPGFLAGEAATVTVADSSQPACANGVLVVRASNAYSSTVPEQTLARCSPSGTTAVIAVEPTSDATWTILSRAASVQVSSTSTLWFSIGTVNDSTPVVVVPLGSTGPGASQSAAAVAVALELATKSKAESLPLRLAFADISQPGVMPYLVRRVTETTNAAALIELGPLGGRYATVIGEQWHDALDELSTRSGLLSSLVVDDRAQAWVDRTASLGATNTSLPLLTAVAGGTLPSDVSFDGVIAPSALTVGIDSAYIGEPTVLSSDVGTSADTSDQVDVSGPERVLNNLTSALEVLDGR